MWRSAIRLLAPLGSMSLSESAVSRPNDPETRWGLSSWWSGEALTSPPLLRWRRCWGARQAHQRPSTECWGGGYDGSAARVLGSPLVYSNCASGYANTGANPTLDPPFFAGSDPDPGCSTVARPLKPVTSEQPGRHHLLLTAGIIPALRWRCCEYGVSANPVQEQGEPYQRGLAAGGSEARGRILSCAATTRTS